MTRITFLPRLIALFSLLLLPLSLFAETAGNEQSGMMQTYRSIEKRLQDNVYGIPIYIQSSNTAQKQKGDVYGVISHPFEKLKTSVGKSSNWCDIVTLHLNIKACTVQYRDKECQLTFYSGRKFYEKPEDTFQLNYRFTTTSNSSNYHRSQLRAARGPFGSGNYLIEVEAIPLDEHSSFLHFSYSYDQSFWTRLATSTYLSTMGRNKVGFSIVNTDTEGKPVYIDGVRGVIERNAMRYYFTIQSYLDTLDSLPAVRFDKSANHWFELTEKYPDQLYELDKKDYLSYKKKERQQQLALQQQINQSGGCLLPTLATRDEIF